MDLLARIIRSGRRARGQDCRDQHPGLAAGALHRGNARPAFGCGGTKHAERASQGGSDSGEQDLLDHITIDIVGFQILDGAYRVEFSLHIEAVADDLFLGNIQRIIDGCERR